MTLWFGMRIKRTRGDEKGLLVIAYGRYEGLGGRGFGEGAGGEGVLDGCSRGVEEFAEWLNEWAVVAFLSEVLLGI